jgi:hypothetical protein
MAALDQEESAAQTYADHIGHVASRLKQDTISERDPAPPRSAETHPEPSCARTSHQGA